MLLWGYPRSFATRLEIRLRVALWNTFLKHHKSMRRFPLELRAHGPGGESWVTLRIYKIGLKELYIRLDAGYQWC